MDIISQPLPTTTQETKRKMSSSSMFNVLTLDEPALFFVLSARDLEGKKKLA